MSAYIVNPEHFGVLAAYATLKQCVIYDWGRTTKVETAQLVARELARENIRSVTHRYPNDKDGHRPGPCLLDAEIEEAAALYAAHFITNPQSLAPVQVFKLVQALDYQSCETNDWPLTLAKRQLEWITNEAIRSLPLYENARWSYEQPLPEVEALYEKEV